MDKREGEWTVGPVSALMNGKHFLLASPFNSLVCVLDRPGWLLNCSGEMNVSALI